MTAPPPPQHPGIRPITDDAQVRYCLRNVTGPRQRLCISSCRFLHEHAPTSPDGRLAAGLDAQGRVVLVAVFCTNPSTRSPLPGGRMVQVVTDLAELPEWAQPAELLLPLPTFQAIGTGAEPPPGPSPAEELRRASAAVAPPRIPSPEALAGLLGPEGVRLLEGVIRGERVDLAGVIAVLVQGLGIAARIHGVLDQLGGKVVDGVGGKLDAQTASLDFLGVGLTQAVVPTLHQLALTWRTALADETAQATATAQTEGEQNRSELKGLSGALWRQLVEALDPILKKLLEVLAKALGFLADRVADVGRLLVEGIGGVYRDSLERQAPVTVANVSSIAAAALASALAAGLAAQTTATVLELAHPIKRMGLNQIVGFIADFAGFGQIAGAYTGPSLRWGIRNSTEHRAASVFRSAIPSAGEALEQAFQRHISLADYAHILALHGFPSWWVKVLVDDAFVDPRPRELAQLLESSEVDPVWLAMKLRENGWDDGDVEKGVTAMVIRSTQPGRSRVLSASMRAYALGQITEDELGRHLNAASLREEHQSLWRRAARLERRGNLMEVLGSRVIRQYREDVVKREVAEDELTGLGFAPDEVRARLLAADLERQVKQLREAEAEVEEKIRLDRAASLANLKVQLRAGHLDREQFLAWGEALGYTRAYLGNVADLEQLKGPPAKVEELPFLGIGAVREAAVEAAKLLKDEVRQGRVSALAAQDVLVQLGMHPETARDLVKVAQVLGLPIPEALQLPIPDGRGGRMGWEAVLAEVLGGIRRGQGGRALVPELLAQLGLPTTDVTGRQPWWQLLEDVIAGR